MLPMWCVVWLDTLKSTTQLVKNGGGVSSMVLNELVRDYWYYSLVYRV
jgi:hypothetical protein